MEDLYFKYRQKIGSYFTNKSDIAHITDKDGN